MTDKLTHKTALQGKRILADAVKKEIIRKSKLGQYAIINRQGKPCRVLASRLINNE